MSGRLSPGRTAGPAQKRVGAPRRARGGLTIAAALLNSPAYGLFTLYMVTTGWGITAPPWAGYVGALVSGLLPPLLYLIGSYLPIRALDEVEENVEI